MHKINDTQLKLLGERVGKERERERERERGSPPAHVRDPCECSESHPQHKETPKKSQTFLTPNRYQLCTFYMTTFFSYY
jgi:hypothetical protein